MTDEEKVLAVKSKLTGRYAYNQQVRLRGCDAPVRYMGVSVFEKPVIQFEGAGRMETSWNDIQPWH